MHRFIPLATVPALAWALVPAAYNTTGHGTPWFDRYVLLGVDAATFGAAAWLTLTALSLGQLQTTKLILALTVPATATLGMAAALRAYLRSGPSAEYAHPIHTDPLTLTLAGAAGVGAGYAGLFLLAAALSAGGYAAEHAGAWLTRRNGRQRHPASR